MPRGLRLLAALALALPLALNATGCLSSTSGEMRAWQGQHADALMETWGAPDHEATQSDGDRVFTWISRSSLYLLGYTCRKTMTIGPEGRVTRWSYSGCPPFALTLL